MYVFDNAAPEAVHRLESLSALYDEATRWHIDRLGVGSGWRCVEVGAGGGSIASYLSGLVGPTGHVLATDINIDRMPKTLPANIEARRHDIVTNRLPVRTFDLVHARAVLPFVSDRPLALKRMVAATKPGGWLLIEELVPHLMAPFEPEDDPDAELTHRARQAVLELMKRTGADPGLAARLPHLMDELGLIDQGAAGYFVPTGTPASAELVRANIDQTADALVEAGLMTAADLDRCRQALARPASHYPVSLPLVSVWGRRPP